MTTFCTILGTILYTGICVMFGAYMTYALMEEINGMKK